MTIKERDKILKGAKEAFFLAMLDGYAGGENRKSVKTISNNGCTKTITFTYGDYIVNDEWHTNPDSNKSAGTTGITYCGTPVWWMSYQGEYSKDLIPFLKKALRKQYERKRGKFIGCRGPKMFMEHGAEYTNECIGSFSFFWGRESISLKIFPSSSGEIGYHIYSGMALI